MSFIDLRGSCHELLAVGVDCGLELGGDVVGPCWPGEILPEYMPQVERRCAAEHTTETKETKPPEAVGSVFVGSPHSHRQESKLVQVLQNSSCVDCSTCHVCQEPFPADDVARVHVKSLGGLIYTPPPSLNGLYSVGSKRVRQSSVSC